MDGDTHSLPWIRARSSRFRADGTDNLINTVWKPTALTVKVFLRRLLCEFRDNWVGTNAALNAIYSALRNMIRGAEPCPILATRNNNETIPMRLPTYVLVTPARNEAAFIGRTIESVIAQTVLPLKWVIVSDGSTDATNAIVSRFAAEHDWIELVTLPPRAHRNFAGKVAAFNVGQARFENLTYDAIANLDADVSFDPDYFSFLLQRFADDPQLGLVGTPYRDPLNQPYDYRFVSREHVTGPCQLFRRECFAAIGGYMPVKAGAVDRIADIAARMKGWKTRTFTEKMYLHHRHTGTAEQSLLTSMFRDGGKDYSVGTSPIWEVCRTAYQMTKRPLFFGGLMLGIGYVWAAINRVERPVPSEMVEFCRREQMQRLKAFLSDRTILPQGARK